MSEFTITIELDGCTLKGDEYVRLDELMASLGFRRRVYPPSPLHPLNLAAHPQNTPHATYVGQADKDSSTLGCLIESRIKETIQDSPMVRVVDGASLFSQP